MATFKLSPDLIYTFKMQPLVSMTFNMGVQGPAGVTDLTISPAPDNRLELKPDGLYVGPPQFASTNW